MWPGPQLLLPLRLLLPGAVVVVVSAAAAGEMVAMVLLLLWATVCPSWALAGVGCAGVTLQRRCYKAGCTGRTPTARCPLQ